MARSNTPNGRRIDDLIVEAQKLSEPRNGIPAPPTHPATPHGHVFGEGPFEDLGDLERSKPPPWFDPGAGNTPIDDPDQEVPLLPDGTSVPDPSTQDQGAEGRIGTEALAYYAPFHFYGPSFWGIYIRDWGIAHLACTYKGSRVLTPSDAWILRGAYHFLLEHERFHFKTELAVTRFQFLSSTIGLYNGFFHDHRAGLLEEAMANASAYRELSGRAMTLGPTPLSGFVSFLERWMLTQPPGYRDYARWSQNSARYAKGKRILTTRIVELGRPVNPALLHADPYTLDLFSRSNYVRLPVRRVHDSRLTGLAHFKPFPKADGIQAFVNTRDHPPPHVHVEFIASGKVAKLRWPDLEPLDNISELSRTERRAVFGYLKEHHDKIYRKLQKAYPDSVLPPLLEDLN